MQRTKARPRAHDGCGGFTLIELVISIAVATLVTAAATTVLLLALRVNRQSSQTAAKQYTVRSLLSAMENAASTGAVQSLKSESDHWELYAEGETPIFQYISKDQTISVNGAAVLEGVYASHATLENGLLTVSIENSEGAFSSSVYCRTIKTKDVPEPTMPIEVEPTGKLESFLTVLASQYGSTGQIIYSDGIAMDEAKYYSEWYIGGYADHPGWNTKTPWCACFVSWALVQVGTHGSDGHNKWFAEVDDFMAYFQQNKMWKADGAEIGDLVFFDWINDDVPDAQHVGVVIGFSEDEKQIYTIEGNSAGRVAFRSYETDDWRILGYGSIDFD